ncbi:hypothetical protein DIQ79_30865 [Mycolicibacterium smegmatis]|uniref:Uncharacterized protein n=1 Tax=Mycolicibacterium smegmatis (strain ATCC 700084 / mc(2)155) TaxID=246196 RepID=A0QS11_MYCS2|nr:conserved hypothetical protein [Mycolicibacterium smegmatis MC2 155]TBM39820.1 hypothetical protein DIQ86_27085 [Mycolicibacterium smegmatis]TBH27895.1 hypothetical protein EYS45_30020 [Mycolicibacterium smegmatis MC2 155]TBM44776.1 hypothetical protein DIQ85_30830 [Mycolicibacterium smegmatis]TBM54595.1 hypothetical protein DIQ83_30580 [Mycolicibacterium smegmatis]
MCEWFARYQTLTRAGVRVRRRGFSWWLGAVWLLSQWWR